MPHTRTNPSETDAVLGGWSSVSFVPFLPFDIEPFRASEDGSNASNDSDGDGACRNSDGTDQNPFGVT